MSKMLKACSLGNMQHPFEALWQKFQFSKYFKTDASHVSKTYEYFYKKFA